MKALSALGCCLLLTLTLSGCGVADSGAAETAGEKKQSVPLAPEAEGDQAIATFAGGCFWCMEAPFDKIEGVFSTTSGYTAGQQMNPTYEQVSSGRTGHTEAVRVVYDPSKVGYEQLLEVFWRNIDPLAVNRQFCDRGTQYRSGIYTHDDQQHQLALASREELATSGKFDKPIATEIQKATTFYPAEDYHQDYYMKNPTRYNLYRQGCGRDRRLQELWGSSDH